MEPKTIYIEDKQPTLKEIQKMVGGYIEFVWDNGVVQVICNEEGKLQGLPVNKEATKIWAELLFEGGNAVIGRMTDCLVGDVVILKGDARLN